MLCPCLLTKHAMALAGVCKFEKGGNWRSGQDELDTRESIEACYTFMVLETQN